jgi:tRNA modification GTPase
MHDLSATIAAVATPPGRGGVGCVRISGPTAHAIAGRLFRPAGASDSAEGPGIRFGRFLDPEGRPLDHGYLVLFPGGRSFTGEPSAELWSHGSPPVLASLLETAVRHGAEPAGPGEFTYRALRHGRLDLARAEAIRDLVDARTAFQARVAFAQAEGSLSRHLQPLRAELTELIARGEAAVEFVDESETHLPAGALPRGIASARSACARMLADYRAGRFVREGASLAITGRPNAGKSSLFNRLLARERAIVTEIPGTTRDTLEEAIDLDGIPLRLVDTAGMRDAGDPVEQEGVRRAERARREADLVLWVIDGTREELPEEEPEPDAVIVVNKCDLPEARERPSPHPGALRVSALTGEGVDALRRALRERLVGCAPLEDPVLTNARHARALEGCDAALGRAAAAAEAGLTEELVLEDLREAVGRLGEITGEFCTEELYDLVFSTFCIGK